MTDRLAEALEKPAERPVQTPRIQPRRGFSLVWLVPIVAAVIALFLGWRTLSQEGPTVTLSFRSADGLVAGQTKVKHKAVDLGTVQTIELSRDMSHVVVRVKMRRDANRVLTEHARFWVVRPRFSTTSISGLETLVSGAYIELDPGVPAGDTKLDFEGLEQPPAVRSDEPGRTFLLDAARVGSLSVGSPVLYRDETVGEVIGVDPGSPGQRAKVQIFVRSPFDAYVHEGSYFWNDSGLAITAGAEGIHFELESIQAVLNGAVAFETPNDALASPVLHGEGAVPLFPDRTTAAASQYRDQLRFLIHYTGSVRGLAVGAPVELYGIQVGQVTDIKLQYQPLANDADVQVRIAIQPGRMFRAEAAPTQEQALRGIRDMVARGLRAQLRSANLITGQLLIALDYVPGAPPANVTTEDGMLVLPGEAGGLENLTRTLDQLLAKVNGIPLDQIAANLNGVLSGLDAIANGGQLKATLQGAAETMTSVRDLAKRLDAGATPLLKKLPDIAGNLQGAVERLNRLAGSLEGGYGASSGFNRQLERLLAQLTDTARSVRILADFLDQHPEALIRGRSGGAGGR